MEIDWKLCATLCAVAAASIGMIVLAQWILG